MQSGKKFWNGEVNEEPTDAARDDDEVRFGYLRYGINAD
jgi:hypothetical protein